MTLILVQVADRCEDFVMFCEEHRKFYVNDDKSGKEKKYLNSYPIRTKNKELFPPGIEPGTFRVLGGCDNHYTTEAP